MAILPHETYPELPVYPDAVLIFPLSAKGFETITWWDSKLADFSNSIYLVKLTLSKGSG